jgi:serine/threonine protein kinase
MSTFIIDHIKKSYNVINIENINSNDKAKVYVYKSIEDTGTYVYKIFEYAHNKFKPELFLAKEIHDNPIFDGHVVKYINLLNISDELDKSNNAVVLKYPFYEIIPCHEIYKSIMNKSIMNKYDSDISTILGNYFKKFMTSLKHIITLLHENKIYHLDLKPGNIIIIHKDDDYKIMLTDFGSSHIFCETHTLDTLDTLDIHQNITTKLSLPYESSYLSLHGLFTLKSQNERILESTSDATYDNMLDTLNKYYDDTITDLTDIKYNTIYHLSHDFFNVDVINNHIYDTHKCINTYNYYQRYTSKELTEIASAFRKIDYYSVGIYMLFHLYDMCKIKEWQDASLKKTIIRQILSLIKKTPDIRASISSIDY